MNGQVVINLTNYSGILNVLGSLADGREELPIITFTRTYTANTYKLYFSENVAEGEKLDKTPDWLKSEETEDGTKYYKEVIFGQPFGTLPSITKEGYSFNGWGPYDSESVMRDAKDITIDALWAAFRYNIAIDGNGGVFETEGSEGNVSVFVGGLTYNGALSSMIGSSYAEFFSSCNMQRPGFKPVGLTWLIPTTTGKGTTYKFVKDIDLSEKFNAESFNGIDWSLNDETKATFYVKWEFDEDAYGLTVTDEELRATYGETDDLDLKITLTINEKQHNINKEGFNIPGYEIVDTKWTKNGNEVDGTTYAPEFTTATSDVYTLTYTLKDTASIETIGFDAPTFEVVTSNIQITIDKAHVDVELINKSLVDQAFVDNLKAIVKNTSAFLNMIEGGDSFVNRILALNTKTDFDALCAEWANEYGVSERDAETYIMAKAGIALAEIDDNANLLVYFGGAKPTLDAIRKQFANAATASDRSLSVVNTEAATISKQFQVYDGTLAPKQGVSGNLVVGDRFNSLFEITNILLRPVADPDVIEQGAIPGDNNGSVGIYDAYLVEVTIQDAENFDIANFTNVIFKDGKYYVHDRPSEVKLADGYVFIYAPVTTLTMTETTGVERDGKAAYTFTLEGTLAGTSQKVVAEVSTASGEAGKYNFVDGNLIVSSYKVYTSETAETLLATVTRGQNGIYTSDSEDFSVRNVSLFIEGEFEIIAEAAINSYRFSPAYIWVDGDRLAVTTIESGDKYATSITSVNVVINSNSYNIDVVEGQESYYVNGIFVFQVVANGTRIPTLYATEYVKSYTLEVSDLNPSENRHFVDLLLWNEGHEGDTTEYANLLKDKESFATSNTITMKAVEADTAKAYRYNVVYTDATYVEFASSTDKGVDAGYAFANSGFFANFVSGVTLPDIDVNTGFEFTGWTGATSIEGQKATLPASPKVTLTANFALVKPEVSVEDINLQIGLGDKNTTLDISDFIDDVKITKGEGIDYTYAWFKQVDGEWQSLPNHSEALLTVNDTGVYAFEVTASKDGYNPKTSEKASCTITILKGEWSFGIKGKSEFDYSNTDFTNQIIISTSYNGNVGEGKLGDLIAEAASGDWLNISLTNGSEEVSSVKDAGTYTLTFTLNKESELVKDRYILVNADGQEVDSLTFTITVNKAELVISEENGKFTKSFGEALPNMLKTFTVNGEEVEVQFSTSATQYSTAGSYEVFAESLNDNYVAKLEGTNHDWFVIIGVAGTQLLSKIKLVEGNPSVEYNASQNFYFSSATSSEGLLAPLAVGRAVWEEETGRWLLKLYTGNRLLAVFQLYDFESVNGDNRTTPEVDDTLLQGLLFNFGNVGSTANVSVLKDAGKYSIIAEGSTGTFDQGLRFSNSAEILEITKKNLTITNISKEYDGTTAFTTDTTVEGHGTLTINEDDLVTGEKDWITGNKLVVSGSFASEKVGEGLDITGLTLSGEWAKNYSIAAAGTGSIVKSSKEAEISLESSTFNYGDITSENYATSIIVNAKVEGVKVGSDLVGTEITIAKVNTEGNTEVSYSKGGYLPQGQYIVTVKSTSDYYQVEETKTFTITVSQIKVTVTVTGNITKIYDKTTNVLQELSLNGILENDEVTVSGAYANARPGTGITVTFTLGGADAANYKFEDGADLTTGDIEEAIINITATINPESGFVDGEQAAGETTFSIALPLDESADAADLALASLTTPAKGGYTFKHWLANGVALSAENINDILESALATKTLAINAAWEINTYDITVVIDDEQGSYTASNEGIKKGKVHTYNYYDSVTFTSTAKTGYVALGNEVVINNIDENTQSTVEFKFRSASVTFNLLVNKAELYPTNSTISFVGEGWTAQGDNAVTRAYSFVDAKNMLAKDFLASVSVYGYTFGGWQFAGEVVAITDSTTLQDLMLDLDNDFTGDPVFNLTAKFNAKTPTITFDAGEGILNPISPEPTYTYVQPWKP